MAPARELATTAGRLVDSIGINTHLYYGDTAYNRFDDIVRPRLLELGIRHLRDGARTDTSDSADATYYRRLRRLGTDGLRLDLITSIQTRNTPATDFSRLADVQRWTGGAVDSFEGVNEPDLSGLSDWVSATRLAQAQLARAVQNTPALSGLQVLAPSLTRTQAADALGPLGSTATTGNVHHYFGGRAPETRGWGDDGYGSTSWAIRRMAGPVTGRAPVVATESGYHDDVSVSQGVPDDVIASYLPRLLLSHLQDGISRTYLYELLDNDRAPASDASYGLLRSDGTPKPAYRAVKSLIQLMSGPASPSPPAASLSYTLTGDVAGVRRALFQKTDGIFWLALWTDQPTWDVNKRQRIPAATRRLSVDLGGRAAATGLVQMHGDGLASRSSVSPTLPVVVLDQNVSFLQIRALPSALSTRAPARSQAGAALTPTRAPGSPLLMP